MQDHIAKPIDPDRLIETVAHYYQPPAVEPAGQNQPAAPQSRSPADLPEIDGLDARDGLKRVGGNRQLYVKLLRQFAEKQGPAIEQVNEALAAGDVALAERTAHSLKGVAGNLGATRVQSTAARLEKAIRDRQAPGDIVAARNQAAEELARLVAELRRVLGASAEPPPSAGGAPPADPAESLAAAARLAKLLSEFDPAAADFLESHRAKLRPLFDDEGWPKFEKLVQEYAFVEAQQQLDGAARSSSAG
jgi:two-component system sensor histidine kinase/response regulator